MISWAHLPLSRFHLRQNFKACDLNILQVAPVYVKPDTAAIHERIGFDPKPKLQWENANLKYGKTEPLKLPVIDTWTMRKLTDNHFLRGAQQCVNKTLLM